MATKDKQDGATKSKRAPRALKGDSFTIDLGGGGSLTMILHGSLLRMTEEDVETVQEIQRIMGEHSQGRGPAPHAVNGATTAAARQGLAENADLVTP